jgi:hypothetical protein
VLARSGPTEAGRATLGEESLGTAQPGFSLSPADASPQVVGNQLAPSALTKQPAAHFPSPCSAGHPGRSRSYGYALVCLGTWWIDPPSRRCA